MVAAVDRPELVVRDWREINKNLFSALKLERIATFLILSIEIIVASFCIVCTLLLMMTEKSKEIAILKALGATDGAILRTFMTEGMIIGGIGTILGVSTGLALCTGLSWFGLRLDPDVYYIDRLPINVSALDYGIGDARGAHDLHASRPSSRPSRPRSSARSTACATSSRSSAALPVQRMTRRRSRRESAPSFCRTLAWWNFTVRGAISSIVAMSSTPRPRSSRVSTWRSRSERAPSPAVRAAFASTSSGACASGDSGRSRARSRRRPSRP